MTKSSHAEQGKTYCGSRSRKLADDLIRVKELTRWDDR